MRTAKDEAERGRAKFQNDEEIGSERPEERLEERLEERSEERDEDIPPNTVSEERNGDIYGLNADEVGSRVRPGSGSAPLGNHNLELSPVWRRPSSVDGSLSIPDDTPSVQARDHPIQFSYGY